MDPMLDMRLKAIEEKLEQTQETVLRIRRAQRNSQLFKLFYWTIILLATFGAFYYVQPYITQVIDTYTGIQNSQEQFSSISDLGSINSIIEQLKGTKQ
jgi:hypothetical protein